METSVACGGEIRGGIFHFGLVGNLLKSGPFDCRLTGYARESPYAVTRQFSACSYSAGGVTVDSYCDSNDRVVLRMSAPTSAQGTPHAHYWHASAISVAAYGRSKDATIVQALHSTLAEEDFRMNVDRRDQTD